MKCQKCQKEIEDHVSYCPFCGAKFGKSPKTKIGVCLFATVILMGSIGWLCLKTTHPAHAHEATHILVKKEKKKSAAESKNKLYNQLNQKIEAMMDSNGVPLDATKTTQVTLLNQAIKEAKISEKLRLSLLQILDKLSFSINVRDSISQLEESPGIMSAHIDPFVLESVRDNLGALQKKNGKAYQHYKPSFDEIDAQYTYFYSTMRGKLDELRITSCNAEDMTVTNDVLEQKYQEYMDACAAIKNPTLRQEAETAQDANNAKTMLDNAASSVSSESDSETEDGTTATNDAVINGFSEDEIVAKCNECVKNKVPEVTTESIERLSWHNSGIQPCDGYIVLVGVDSLLSSHPVILAWMPDGTVQYLMDVDQAGYDLVKNGG